MSEENDNLSGNKLGLKETTARLIPLFLVSVLLFSLGIYLFHKDFTVTSVVTAVVQSLAAALLEEFIFRWLILGRLLNHFGDSKHVLFILISAALFSLAHLANAVGGKFSIGFVLMQLLGTVFGGLMFGFIYYYTRSFWFCFFVHLVYDLGSFFIAMGAGDLAVTGTVDLIAEILLIVLPAIVVAGLVIKKGKFHYVEIAAGCVLAVVIAVLKYFANI